MGHTSIRARNRVFSWIAIGAAIAGCAGSGASGPSFEVSFDRATPRSAREQSVRVELYLVDECAGVALGTRPVPAFASTFVLREGPSGAFGDVLEPGDYGLYAVAQDAACAVVAAGCAPVTITGGNETLEVTLSALQVQGCSAGEVCSLQTGDCVDDGGGSGGSGGAGGAGGTSGARIEDGLIVLYAFDEGSGSTVVDQSFVLPKHDLSIADPSSVSWSEGHLSIDAQTVLSTAGGASKVVTRAQASGELSVEAWVRPAITTQTGPARIITVSTSTTLRNFMLGQDGSRYAARFRADGEADWSNGNPTLFSTDGTATTALTHVVYTHSASGDEVLYVDGMQDQSFARTGGLAGWDDTYPILVADEATGDRAWLGELHLIAIYDRALEAAEVEQNFLAGP